MPEQRPAYGRATLDRGAGADEPLTFTASSTGLNRYGYSLRNEGWRLDAYNANPVLLWMHDPMRPPIGQGHALAKDDKVLLEGVTFDREDELARAVESKFRRGFLNAVSVSWDFTTEDGAPVLDWWRLKPEQMRDEMFYDLIEVSAVSVPGDPRALIKQSRLALKALGKELVELFDEQEDPAGQITKGELAVAVAAELVKLGIELPVKKTTPDPAPPVAGLDKDAASALLAAFDLQEGTDS